jgi:FkbM family methyltransferase
MNQILRASIRTGTRIANLVPYGMSLVSGLEVYFAQLQGIGYVTSLKEETLAAMKTIHSPSPTIFDVGANRGDWTRNLLASLPQARIYAFEPSPTNIDKLEKMKDDRVTIVPTAVSNFEGTASLYTTHSGSESASLFNYRPPSTQPPVALDREKIQVTTLDTFVKQHQITSIDFMKMDLEGGEYAALEGAVETLGAGIIRALSFEFGQSNIFSKTYLNDFWFLLNKFSFGLNIIGPTGILIPIREYSSRYEVLRFSNLIAIHDSVKIRPTNYHR